MAQALLCVAEIFSSQAVKSSVQVNLIFQMPPQRSIAPDVLLLLGLSMCTAILIFSDGWQA
jgi:hypothetical protein